MLLAVSMSKCTALDKGQRKNCSYIKESFVMRQICVRLLHIEQNQDTELMLVAVSMSKRNPLEKGQRNIRSYIEVRFIMRQICIRL